MFKAENQCNLDGKTKFQQLYYYVLRGKLIQLNLLSQNWTFDILNYEFQEHQERTFETKLERTLKQTPLNRNKHLIQIHTGCTDHNNLTRLTSFTVVSITFFGIRVVTRIPLGADTIRLIRLHLNSCFYFFKPKLDAIKPGHFTSAAKTIFESIRVNCLCVFRWRKKKRRIQQGQGNHHGEKGWQGKEDRRCVKMI